jgi:hypothetical protein
MEAKVAPQDIDQIGVGAHAVIRTMAGNQRTMPELNGRVTYVSVDVTREQPSAGVLSCPGGRYPKRKLNASANSGSFRACRQRSLCRPIHALHYYIC